MRVLRVLLLTVLLLLLAGILTATGSGRLFDSLLLSRSFVALPAPWQLPKQQGEAVLHLAMVHDVLHERFPLHGPAWHQARLARAERELGTLADEATPLSPRQLALIDDIAVAHERLGHPEQGIPLLRRKLARQRAALPADASPQDPSLYTTCANLGTLLIHAQAKQAIGGDAAAAADLREGLQFIRDAMVANPDAHFGRETWQAEAVASILAAVAAPARMQQFDLIGLPLDEPRAYLRMGGLSVRSYSSRIRSHGGWEAVQAQCDGGDTALRSDLRSLMPAVMRQLPDGTPDPTPFDEPALGIVGMWTLGGGANPHFALALAHLMEAARQRHLAWDAYERAVDLGDGFWPDPAIRTAIIAHCRDRQHALQLGLGTDAASLRALHQAQLAEGLAYRAAYQAHEAAQLAAGMDPDDPGLMRAFIASRPPIATATGDADSYRVEEPPRFIDLLPLWLGGGSLVLFLAVLIERLDWRRTHAPRTQEAATDAA